jgi:hypothetical protein
MPSPSESWGPNCFTSPTTPTTVRQGRLTSARNRRPIGDALPQTRRARTVLTMTAASPSAAVNVRPATIGTPSVAK